jgi:hypothetical protein
LIPALGGTPKKIYTFNGQRNQQIARELEAGGAALTAIFGP